MDLISRNIRSAEAPSWLNTWCAVAVRNVLLLHTSTVIRGSLMNVAGNTVVSLLARTGCHAQCQAFSLSHCHPVTHRRDVTDGDFAGRPAAGRLPSQRIPALVPHGHPRTPLPQAEATPPNKQRPFPQLGASVGPGRERHLQLNAPVMRRDAAGISWVAVSS